MFSFDRFNLSRFSLGSQDNTIHIELLLAENLESVAGVAIPVETTAFFNDILRGTARGAIGIASTFESYAAMNSAALMRANIIVKGLLGDTLQAMSDGAQNSMIVNVLADNLGASSYASADILWHEAYADALTSLASVVKDILIDPLLYEVLGSVSGAGTQSTEQVSVTVTIPPGGELRIDSDTFRVLLNGENVLDKQSGDWLMLSRDLLYLDIESAIGNGLSGKVVSSTSASQKTYSSTSGGGSTSTTSSGGGQTSGATTLESSNVLPSQTSGQAVHNHGLSRGARLATTSDGQTIDGYETFVWSGAHVHPAHTHEIDDHSHSVRIPSHSHNVTIPGHSHNITIPAHEHDITPGIYFYGSPRQFDLYVNGKKKATIVSTDTELDLTQYLVDTSSKLIPRGSWLSIEIRPNDLAYVSIDMFVQGFVQSRGDATV